MKVQVVGCTYRTASVQLREQLAFSPEQAASALDQLRTRYPGTEAVLLSTCNRVELYIACEEDSAAPTHEDAARFLADCKGVSFHQVFEDLFERNGEDAIRHLFSVAASLDSMVVGEPQILMQVKQAYALAQEHAAAGPLTSGVFQTSFRVAKRIATETSIYEKRVSIPSVAICDFAAAIFERFDDKQILVIGAGDMGEETLRFLKDEGAQHVTVINRSRPRAEALAEAWEGRVADWQDLHQELVRADLVISTTGATEPIVTVQEYRQIEEERFQRPLCILDLAIPRDFDAKVGDCLGVYLYSIDDLQKAADKNRGEREKERHKAIHIVEEETARFMAELNHRATGPIIKRLRESWGEIKEDELKRLFRKLPELDDRGRNEVNQAFDRLINKLLHPPLHTLRDESKSNTHHGLLDALKRLFLTRD